MEWKDWREYIIMPAIWGLIKGWFCRHDYEFVGKQINKDGDEVWYWKCSRCNKLKIL